MEAIQLIIIGCVFLVLYKVFAFEKAPEEEKNTKKAQGIIRQIVINASSIRFYVDIMDGSKIYKGRSEAYIGTKTKYKVGEQVEVKFCPRKNSQFKIFMQDETLVPAQLSPRWKYLFLVLTFLFFGGAVVVIVSKII